MLKGFTVKWAQIYLIIWGAPGVLLTANWTGFWIKFWEQNYTESLADFLPKAVDEAFKHLIRFFLPCFY